MTRAFATAARRPILPPRSVWLARLLFGYALSSMTLYDVQFAAVTDIGRERDHNEDNYLVDKKLGLFVVCDGMGGHAAGEVASALAVRTFHEEVKKEAELIADYLEQKSGAARVSKRDLLNMLEFAVNRASSRVHAEALRDPEKRGMGTTLVSVLLVGQQAFIINVGDSRIYLLREGIVEQITEDHTVYNELIRRKKLPREQVEKLVQKNAITRAVGVYEHAQPESLVLDVLAGDRFLLCSDGLSRYFQDDLAVFGGYLAEPVIDTAVRSLVEGANDQGGIDNITVVLVAVGDPAARDEGRARRLQLKRDLLARMPLFRPLTDLEILRVLQVTDVVGFKHGQTVMKQGDRGEELYIVLHGSVRVMRGEAEIARLSQGDHVGEMALVRSQPRSATVISEGESELMVIRRPDFFEILRKEPQLAVKLLWQFLGVLADRLADTSRELGEAREELAAEDVTPDLFVEEDEEIRKSTVRAPIPPSLRRPT